MEYDKNKTNMTNSINPFYSVFSMHIITTLHILYKYFNNMSNNSYHFNKKYSS